ncbi:hypothetical protein [uncultured Fretibacterium sp.]|uniref:GspE/PulE/PilB domain-containing protein n=1 Tax=uncultured Fretibacterium sp. TaxID=1678694 RepID=UPI002625DCD9|nr:hypothetical protein [uncultured Fretibacterium sp.]
MEAKRRKLGEILLQMRLVSPEELKLALEEQTKSPGKRLGTILIEMGGTTGQALTSALGRQFMLPVVKVANYADNVAARHAVPRELMESLKAFPLEFQEHDSVLLVAISDPMDVVTQNILRAKISFPIRFALAPEEEIQEALRTEAVPDQPPLEPEPEPASPSSAVLVSIDTLKARHPMLGNVLLRAGAITQQQLTMALTIQARSSKKLGEILLSEGLITSSRLAEALSEQLKLPLLVLGAEEPEPAAILLVPRSVAARLNLLPLRIEEDGRLLVAMADPLDLLAQDEVQLTANCGIRIGVATLDSIRQNLPRFYSRTR